MLIALIVFQGCTRLNSRSLDELQKQVLAVHPRGSDDVVSENFGIVGVARPEDCMSYAATLAVAVKNTFE